MYSMLSLAAKLNQTALANKVRLADIVEFVVE